MTSARYVFACSRRHRVAVDASRYWTAARCPTCKSPVDPLRAARFRQWLRGAAPRSRLRIRALVLTPLDGLGWLLVLFALLLALVYHRFGDRTWWGTALIYTGRWPWLIPIAAAGAAGARLAAQCPRAARPRGDHRDGAGHGRHAEHGAALEQGQVAPDPHLQCRRGTGGVAAAARAARGHAARHRRLPGMRPPDARGAGPSRGLGRRRHHAGACASSAGFRCAHHRRSCRRRTSAPRAGRRRWRATRSCRRSAR